MGKTPSCALVLGALLSMAVNADAGLLIGTYGPNAGSDNLTTSEINALINDYNTRFGAGLATIDESGGSNATDSASFVGDVETDDGSTSGFGSQLSYFTATEVALNAGTFNVFDAGLDLTAGISNSTVVAFNYTGFVPFYYLVKDGSFGSSLFLAMTGYNAAYIDEGDGPSSLLADGVGSSYTFGDTADTSKIFDPNDSGAAVSNIRFFVAGSTPPQANVVPEPGTFVMFGAGMLLVGFRRRFRTA